MEAVIRTYDLKDYYYPTLFPLKETNTLTWKMLEAQSGLKIAADLVSRGATISRKTREAISRIQGDIPKIAISREKNEDELTEYDIMVAMSSSNPDLRALVEFWAEDTKYCWDGVAAVRNGLHCAKFRLERSSSPIPTMRRSLPNMTLII